MNRGRGAGLQMMRSVESQSRSSTGSRSHRQAGPGWKVILAAKICSGGTWVPEEARDLPREWHFGLTFAIGGLIMKINFLIS